MKSNKFAIQPAQTNIALAMFFIIFALVGSALFYFQALKPLSGIYNARNWHEIPCSILSAEVKTHDDSDGDTYSIDIRYKYQVAGKEYESNTYDFFFGSSSGYNGKKAVVDKYRSMDNPVCYVNPDNPDQVVLNRGFHLGYTWCIFPLPFMLIGYGGLIGMYIMGRKRKLLSDGDIYQTRELKTYGPIIKLIFSCSFALFWNVPFSVMVYEAFTENDTPAKFFSILFGLIGFGLIIWSLYSLMQCFNPKVTMTMTPGVVIIGSGSEFSWNITGNVSRIKELEIRVIGREEEEVGDTTKKEVFYEKTIVNTTDTEEIASSSIRLVANSDMQPTYRSNKLNIKWLLSVRGYINYWPDIKQEFEFDVIKS